MLTVHDVNFDFSVIDYLEQHLPNHFDQASQSEYRCCCLFHSERTPSMYVNVDTGNYFCHACHARGNVVRLVQKIGKHRSYSDALDWLMSHYGPDRDETDESFVLRFTERHTAPPITYVDESFATRYLTDSNPYMSDVRGLPVSVLRQFDIGYDRQSNSVTIPWRGRQGLLLTVKHRAIDTKRFWYEPRCKALRQHLWGLHRATGESVVYICEAEIDAMTLWAADKPAVALGGSHMTEEQSRQLLLSGIQAVVPVCDRDDAGAQANQQIADALRPLGIDVFKAVWPIGFDGKDCNAIGVDGCRLLTYETPKMFF